LVQLASSLCSIGGWGKHQLSISSGRAEPR
jgi:hypothetical protein